MRFEVDGTVMKGQDEWVDLSHQAGMNTGGILMGRGDKLNCCVITGADPRPPLCP